MAKTTDYFSHDADARNDQKILSLRMKMGVEGYGIYFMLLEWERAQEDFIIRASYEILAFDLRTEAEKVRAVVEDFGLFVVTEDGFWSESFAARMRKMQDVSRKRSAAVAQRADRQPVAEPAVTKPLQKSTNALQNSEFVKESKIENINKNKKINSSSIDDEGGVKRVCVREEMPSSSTPSPDFKESFDLKSAVTGWVKEPGWVESVACVSDLTPGMVVKALEEFVNYCIAKGKKHEDDGDARSHFAQWIPSANGERALKRLMNRAAASQKRTSTVAPAQDSAPAIRPSDYIRSRGYDPAKVTMQQASDPAWRAKNPPTL